MAVKHILKYTLVTSTLLSLFSCNKFLDINTDPNHPLSVGESLILSPVEVTLGTQVVGGFNGTTNAYWAQQISLNQPAPDIETYKILPSDVDNTWSFYIYPNILNNLNNMVNQAEAANHYEYTAIGKTLMAYTFAIATDIWGDIPFSQAFNPSKYPKPVYDAQESVYNGIQLLLDSAIIYSNKGTSEIAPGSDDYIYGGDMALWRKLMYMLKARFYLRLSNAPGRTAALQADSALAAIQNGFASNSDNTTMPYIGAAGQESPWYENTLPGAGGVVLGEALIDSLVARNDPRLPVIATTNNNGKYVGRPAGIPPVSNPASYSYLNIFYGGYINAVNTAGSKAPLYLATYTEQLFIQAEATFVKSGATAADPIYRAAIQAHMDMLGISAANEATYLASRPTLTSTNALQSIINEKYIADFLSLEPYNDWRRTGYPKLALAQNAYVQYIPLRYPYGTTTILANPQPQQSAKLSDPVWWNSSK